MQSKTREEIFAALQRLIDSCDGFVSAWGEANLALLNQLENFVGARLPEDYRAFLLRFGNANIGYLAVNGCGPLNGLPSAQLLTEERQSEWPVFPKNCLAVGEENTDLIVLRLDGVIEVRTESSRDLAVFKTFPSFLKFLQDCIEYATERAKWLGKIPESFDPWKETV